MSTGKQKVLDEVRRDLFSGDDAVVMKALHKVRDIGKSELVEPLIALYLNSSSSMVRNESADMLNTLKVSGVEAVFAEALLNEAWKTRRGELVSFMWNSGIQPVDYMDVIARVATEGDYMTAVECLTLIENLDESIPEEQLLESISLLGQHIQEHPDDDKRVVLATMLHVLQGSEESED